ncbi:DUF4177 domain-containing protein [Pontibaca salina]|uniref:DUF4177 domain-containing protein n=1 Tax=Pontibaca salina TaxID=2795731 RepID=A0A934HL59_9RHOB|nr:DUF4177 domain-containing protein [Pontibaca salina]MBI6630123.1 DUF4177 domain-containing protein [Pontibaca salina]
MYEYKVIPAPDRGEKTRSVKTPEGRFARSIEAALNEMAAAGWEFQRAETLPSTERSGFTGSSVNMRSLLIFRRPQEGDAAQFQPRKLEGPAAAGAPTLNTPERSGGSPPLADGRKDPVIAAPAKKQDS